MNVALEARSTYDDFVLEKDILYFRVGDHGLISFHGKNFNVKKRIASDQFEKMIGNSAFFKANTDCYVNVNKIDMVQEGKVHFNPNGPDSKDVTVTKLRQVRLKELLHQTNPSL